MLFEYTLQSFYADYPWLFWSCFILVLIEVAILSLFIYRFWEEF